MTREEAITIIDNLHLIGCGRNQHEDDLRRNIALDMAIESLQESKTGEWVGVTNGRGGHECSNCHAYAPSYMSGDEYLSNYCPSCGAKMKGGAE